MTKGPRLCCPAFPFKPMKNNCMMLTKLLLLLLQLLSMLLSAAGCALRQPKSRTCFPCNYKGIIVESWDLKQRKCSDLSQADVTHHARRAPTSAIAAAIPGGGVQTPPPQLLPPVYLQRTVHRSYLP
ncbi:unnamed protein product [Arctia plantaginis]|uniref:Uncharacterized protein n=1 Tax=Arctia plantaginis TaxID=874455 RepID=A0A8S1A9P1_ARCPL|nr:unnamed protein product [Arctia plantaginis]